MANVTDGFFADAGKLSGGWGWVLGYGLLLIVSGILALYHPIIAGFAAGVLFGFLLLLYGVLSFLAGIGALSTRGRIVEILLGIVAVAAGFFVLFDPLLGAASLAWAIGVWLLVAGVFEIVLAVKAPHDRGWRILLGLIDVVLGGLLTFSGPAIGIAFMAAAIGISFLFRGVFLVTLGLHLRRLRHS